jgi:RNA polymerase sigma-70 factor (ECF subfamily)
MTDGLSYWINKMPMIEVSTEIIRRAQQGDAEKIGELFERFHLSVFRYLYYRVGDRQTAEDLTSEVFVRMLRFLSSFHPPSTSFQAWLFQIAHNLAIDHFRQQNAHPLVHLEDDYRVTSEPPQAAHDHILTSESLRKALSKLSDDQREVIILRFIAGLPIADAARSLNKSEDAIKALQRRALLALRKTLTDWEVSFARPS